MDSLKAQMKQSPFVWTTQVFAYSYILINVPLIFLVALFVPLEELSSANPFVVAVNVLSLIPAFLLARKFYGWTQRI